MGLPEIIISLQHKASSLITRSGKGTVCLILYDDVVDDNDYVIYNAAPPTDSTDFSLPNILLIRNAFTGGAAKVICERFSTEAGDRTLTEALAHAATQKFTYLATNNSASNATIKTWIETQRSTHHKPYKAVLYNNTANSEAIINFVTEDVVLDGTTVSGGDFVTCIAGALAGLPVDQSLTYHVIPGVTGCSETASPDAAVEAGKLFMIDDGEKVKVSRAVNSKTTLASGESADMKKIKIVEAMDMIKSDIAGTFEDDYIGKVGNSYDNKVLLCTAINGYLSGLAQDGVLYDRAVNEVAVDYEAQKEWLRSQGVDVDKMTEEEIKNANTGSHVFVSGTVGFQDAMEDLTLTLNF